ncbi:hypothetical protein LOZ57_001011 [Ophidiomyces ophidiicola]|uniref:uncharacterized protein n=1 Tax=Ophidiomyces ophidiicola TaxID=1387563 RepID=UPI0020C313BE|nr:uncharacterized protein LOZ57_001011 [Ophidiomyces ophidiicola]KAI1952927.1 hypothetical protein LOZ57_001011 [Ophidiomyces ophidiicola]KAI2057574.1 hypothetical protein LOZ43_003037 [Ophidiomyces ophidiicola]
MFIPIIDPRSKDNSNVFPLDGVDLETVSNADLIGLLDTAPILYQVGGTKVVRISHNLILKSGGRVLPRETRTLQLIAKRTSLRVPRVYRTFQVKEQGRQFGTRGHIIMDYIDGKNLGDCWKQLTGRQKDDIVCQAVGQLFSDFGAGPFDSNSDMEAWFNRKLAFCQRINKAPPEIPPFEFSKFVMTHQDISPRNIILDASEKIWLVDWADSGAFPPAFERGALAVVSLKSATITVGVNGDLSSRPRIGPPPQFAANEESHSGDCLTTEQLKYRVQTRGSSPSSSEKH